ncbi:NAD(P)/FAD-dependent oxidoreductase [Halobiforma nitratireducens]|uniref:FAD dependent oxidoreductase n=1 Tax=Halobiforma nitratireducens JCM 10879 TaxID=1227454 RepID=M0LV21_9EURY|nr:NAD(P)-binding protein [Halobiforma nitratireducens]EMA37316.1 FAD dependent oxidoreductase [Halobiforma nitratireducens JCM 10879]
MTSIGVVGAGAAAAAATYVISETIDDATVTVLEKSGGLCGRAATRRNGDVTYDYGANYVKSDDERVADLLTETLETDGLVEVDGPIWTFDRDGEVSSGRDLAVDEHRWTYRQGVTQIAKRLFGRTEADVHRRTRVERISRDGGLWRLEDTDGEVWGPFDCLLLNPPAPQTVDLVRSAGWESDDLRETLAETIEGVPYRTIWTGVFHYPFELEVPYYALVNTDKDHEVGWIAREECKPGHVPAGESVLVVQANHEWSRKRYDEPPERNLEALADIAADLLEDERLTEPDWTDHQGWRYALPEDGVPTGPLRSAEKEGLYCLGDWVAGEGRLHAALRNGLEVGERIAYASS